MLQQQIQNLRLQFENEIATLRSLKEIEQSRIKYLGKKGLLQNLMQLLKDLSAEEKPSAGKLMNDLKQELEEGLQSCLNRIGLAEQNEKLQSETLDISLPGRRRNLARKHPILQMRDQMLDILKSLGFSLILGPDIESDYYNFEALNFPPDHPARDMQDTFYLSPDRILRTHCSNMQVRCMETHKPPIRICCPGKCFRNEEVTARSHVLFHQVDVLYVDTGVKFGDLLATLELFLGLLFGKDLKVQYRPSYFPFVEPGLEVDIQCLLCKGRGCSVCKRSGWLEIAGAGMVHPNVLSNGGIDPNQYTGFAWGMGLERIVMVKHRIGDIRLFLENDMRFLEQFP